MPSPEDEEPLSVSLGKRVELKRPLPVAIKPIRPPLPTPESSTDEQPQAAPQPTPFPPAKAPTAELLERCREHMLRATFPKTARELVNLWYADWRGRKDKPKSISKKHKAGHVDRASKWLDRHEKAGRLRVVDHKGKWNAKRYLQVDGADWRRPRRTKAPKGSEKISER